ncbi:(d)CMP kinase [Thermodesulfobacteriota bacterium]
MKRLLITIDGPGGAGKTTVSRILADKLDYRYIDTGALYRGVALAVQKADISSDNESEIEALCEKLELMFVWQDKHLRLLSNGRDISDLIRTPEISMLASAVSAKAVVRKYLLDLQRELGKEGGTVFEGRDMGTVVFPEADIKFFLDASLKTRALRRYRELAASVNQTLEAVEEDMRRRDRNDSTRSLAPLKPADDAVIIDSSGLTIDGVVDQMVECINTAR